MTSSFRLGEIEKSKIGCLIRKVFMMSPDAADSSRFEPCVNTTTGLAPDWAAADEVSNIASRVTGPSQRENGKHTVFAPAKFLSTIVPACRDLGFRVGRACVGYVFGNSGLPRAASRISQLSFQHSRNLIPTEILALGGLHLGHRCVGLAVIVVGIPK